MTALAVLATSTVFERLGFEGGVATKIVALIVVAALIVGAGIIGFDLIMRLQVWITIITGVLVGVTAGFLGGAADEGLSLVANVFLVLPALPLLIVVLGYLRTGSLLPAFSYR